MGKGHATFGKSFEIWSDCLRVSFKDFIPIIPVVDVQKKDAGPVGIGRLQERYIRDDRKNDEPVSQE